MVGSHGVRGGACFAPSAAAAAHHDTLWSSSLPHSSQSLHARISMGLVFRYDTDNNTPQSMR